MMTYVYIAALIISVFGVYLYKIYAIKKTIFADINFRTLHEYPTPKGGGIVFSIIYIFIVFFNFLMDQLSYEFFMILCLGGAVVTTFGFIDDVKNINARKKLMVQILLSCWIIYWIGDIDLLFLYKIPYIVELGLLFFFLIWFMNAYNFIDGIDGMAASSAVFTSSTLALVLMLTNPENDIIFLFIYLAVVVGGFLFFNWPKASIFMGDAGSVFLGYTFGSLLLISMIRDELSVWTWLVVFGYYFADTTFTQIARVILVKKWYLSHRSHAYQNLARITGSHLKVTVGVVLYNVVWILPLTLWSAMKPETALIAVVLAITPGLVVAFKFGPLLSSS